MSKKRDDELNKGSPGGESPFSLEDILAEYAAKEVKERKSVTHDTIPIPVIPFQGQEPPPWAQRRDNVVQFPGKMPTPDGTPPPPSKNSPPVESLPPVESAPEDDGDDNGESGAEDASEPKSERFPKYKPKRMVPPDGEALPFPSDTENPVARKINKIKKQADVYAEHMFEEEGTEDSDEVRRAERYIPGVDMEEPEPFLRERKPRRPPPAAPDLPPQELYRRYTKGLKFLRLRSILVFLLALPALFLTLVSALGGPLPNLLADAPDLQILLLSGLLVGAMILGIDVWARGLLSILNLHLGMDALMALSCIAVLADALTMGKLDSRTGQLPYCAASMLCLACSMWGSYLKRRGQRAACRTAASTSEPYLVTLDDDKWNGRDAYAKWNGAPIGFGRQIQAPDGAQRIFYITAPLLFLASLLFSLMSSVGRNRPQDLLWCLAATLVSSASFSGLLCFAIPWDKLCQRLGKSGAAIAGWDGVTGTGGGCGILLMDMDLFPPGSVSMNGIKVFGEFQVEKVVGYAATLIRDSGSGLDKIFHDLLRAQGAIYRRSADFYCHEGGGLCAVIRDQQVAVGSAAFMHLMRVGLPQGLNVKNAVFCAIDGELAGIFALSYALHGAVEPALNALIRNRVSPVLATRDFNIIPAMLRQRFKLPVEKMEFPPVDRRVELSSGRQEHSPILTAVLCREGLGPYSEAVVGGKRLRRAVRASAILASLGAAVGVLLAFYLTFSAAYSALSPANLLVFLVMWLVPTPLIAGWVSRY